MRKPLALLQAVVLLLCTALCFPMLYGQHSPKIDKAGKTEVIQKTAAFMKDYYIFPKVGIHRNCYFLPENHLRFEGHQP